MLWATCRTRGCNYLIAQRIRSHPEGGVSALTYFSRHVGNTVVAPQPQPPHKNNTRPRLRHPAAAQTPALPAPAPALAYSCIAHASVCVRRSRAAAAGARSVTSPPHHTNFAAFPTMLDVLRVLCSCVCCVRPRLMATAMARGCDDESGATSAHTHTHAGASVHSDPNKEGMGEGVRSRANTSSAGSACSALRVPTLSAVRYAVCAARAADYARVHILVDKHTLLHYKSACVCVCSVLCSYVVHMRPCLCVCLAGLVIYAFSERRRDSRTCVCEHVSVCAYRTSESSLSGGRSYVCAGVCGCAVMVGAATPNNR